MTHFSRDMDRFIHELPSKKLRLVDDGIDIDPSAKPSSPMPPPFVPPPFVPPVGQSATRSAAAKSRSAAGGRANDGARVSSASSGWARPQIVSYFIDYFVVFVTVAGIYFAYRLVSLSTGSESSTAGVLHLKGKHQPGSGEWDALFHLPFLDLPLDYWVRTGLMTLVCISVLFFVYKFLHRILAIPSIGERCSAYLDSPSKP